MSDEQEDELDERNPEEAAGEITYVPIFEVRAAGQAVVAGENEAAGSIIPFGGLGRGAAGEPASSADASYRARRG